MTEQTQSTRLVNTDALTTQELRALKLSVQDGATVPMPALQQVYESKRRRLTNFLMKAFVTVFAATTLFSLVATVVLYIVVPPWYRGLMPRQQAVWCNRIAALCDLQPHGPENDVLAVDNSAVDADAALILLDPSTPTPSVLEASPQPTAAGPKGGNNRSTAMNTAEIKTPASSEPTLAPSPTPRNLPVVASLDLNRLKWEEQGWNNCGPTTITMGLSFYGYSSNQEKAVDFLKPNVEDKNVSPAEMVEFVNRTTIDNADVHGLFRPGGTPEILKALLDADFPVVIERGIDVVGSGWMGHYSLLVGYDDTTGEYLLYDSYFGQGDGGGKRELQAAINAGWKQFNNTFIVIYDPARESDLQQVLGDYMDEDHAAEIALENARAEAMTNPEDKWAWFNIGSALTALGRYQEAVLAYDRARTLSLPFRMLWYQFGPYEAYYQVGRYDDVIALALANERQTLYVEETYYFRGLAYAAQSNVEEAVRQFDRALALNRNFDAAREAKQAVLEGRYQPPV